MDASEAVSALTPTQLRDGSPPQDLICIICLELLNQPMLVTSCGHSFCSRCIYTHLQHSDSRATCPSPGCSASFSRPELVANVSLANVVERYESKVANLKGIAVPDTNAAQLAETIDNLNYSDVSKLILTLVRRRESMREDLKTIDLEVCQEFLSRAYREREVEKHELERQMAIISNDITIVSDRIDQARQRAVEWTTPVAADEAQAAGVAVANGVDDSSRVALRRREDTLAAAEMAVAGAAGEATLGAAKPSRAEMLKDRRARVYTHFKDLQASYFDSHQQFDGDKTNPGLALDTFQANLAKFTKYKKLNMLAEIRYGHLFNTSSIVSSIEFDRDEDFFATAGVSKKIKVYDYEAIMSAPHTEVHEPLVTMICRTKISCLSWNHCYKDRIASSDYDGIVQVWDASTGRRTASFEEHEKRVWSVDSCCQDPTRLASGSDDLKVKIWSTKQPQSVATIPSKANVCCVKFHPENGHHIAFGSADHHIHYYDLRNLRQELFTFRGHGKAVSYVRFLSNNELVSASTDSSLKIWDLKQNTCTRTLKGHTNDKNFVGLTSCGDYIACGSEDNAVYVYYKGLSKPIILHKFKFNAKSDTKDFVSSVAWRKNSDVILAANSVGIIHIMNIV